MNEMIINRYNYQEFFLLYVDNELDAVAKKAVENFILQNPDLEAELLMLQQSILKADQGIVFQNKESLLRFDASQNKIHPGNWEEFAVRYFDNELNSIEKIQVEDFIRTHPSYQQGFDLIQSLKFIPDDTIVFPDKELLYHHENNKPAILPWWPAYAAAVVLLFAGVLWLNNHTATTLSQDTRQNIKPDSSGKVEIIPGERIEIVKADRSPESAADTSNKQHAIVVLSNHHKRNVQTRLSINKSPVKSTNLKKEDVVEVVNIKQEPAPVQISYEVKEEPKKKDIMLAAIDPSKVTTIENQQGKQTNEVSHSKSSIAGTASNTDVGEYVSFANIPVEKKNSFRGILRKASRLIDKTTSFKTSKNSSLLIGNVEIAFQ